MFGPKAEETDEEEDEDEQERLRQETLDTQESEGAAGQGTYLLSGHILALGSPALLGNPLFP